MNIDTVIPDKIESNPAFRFLRYANNLMGWIFSLLVIFILINAFVITVVKVDGESMAPTYKPGQYLLALVIPGINYYAVGDVVILGENPLNKTRIIKRIINVPGESVAYKYEDITLDQNQYFIEGDNRNHSTDSRYFGPALRKQFAGKIISGLPWLN